MSVPTGVCLFLAQLCACVVVVDAPLTACCVTGLVKLAGSGCDREAQVTTDEGRGRSRQPPSSWYCWRWPRPTWEYTCTISSPISLKALLVAVLPELVGDSQSSGELVLGPVKPELEGEGEKGEYR